MLLCLFLPVPLGCVAHQAQVMVCSIKGSYKLRGNFAACSVTNQHQSLTNDLLMVLGMRNTPVPSH